MQKYIGTKIINAKPMIRDDYNTLRSFPTPAHENGADEGYLVEYTDGGKPNLEGFSGYVSWSPKEQFEKAYRVLSQQEVGYNIAIDKFEASFKKLKDEIQDITVTDISIEMVDKRWLAIANTDIEKSLLAYRNAFKI